jgi:two-component system response regulator NreC
VTGALASEAPAMTASSSPSKKNRIVVADDHAVMRAGVRALLRRQPDMEVVGEASNAAELLQRVEELSPDVVISDMRMPGEGVLEAIRTIATRWPSTHVVVFSAFDEPADAIDALRAGACGYVLKQGAEDDLLTAVKRARHGKRFVDAALAANVLADRLDDEPRSDGTEPAPTLSAREQEVLDLVARGYTGPQIAQELGVRIGTVETLRHRIRTKLGLKTRAEFTRFARSSRFRRTNRP